MTVALLLLVLLAAHRRVRFALVELALAAIAAAALAGIVLLRRRARR